MKTLHCFVYKQGQKYRFFGKQAVGFKSYLKNELSISIEIKSKGKTKGMRC